MKLTEIIAPILSFILGIFSALIIETIRKKGKAYLHESNVIMHYRQFNTKKYLNGFELDFTFINTSGHQKLITDIVIVYFETGTAYDMDFANFRNKPTIILEPKKSKCVNFEILPQEKGIETNPYNASFDENTYLLLSYTLNKKRKFEKFSGYHSSPSKIQYL